MSKQELVHLATRGVTALSIIAGAQVPSRLPPDGIGVCGFVDTRPLSYLDKELPNLRRWLRMGVPHVSINPDRKTFPDLLRQRSLNPLTEERMSQTEKCGIVKTPQGGIAHAFPLTEDNYTNRYESLNIPRNHEIKWIATTEIRKKDSDRKETWAIAKAKINRDGKIEDVWAFYLLKVTSISGNTDYIQAVEDK